MSTTNQLAVTIVNRTALSLYRRLTGLERRRGYWPGGDVVELLTEWLAGYGIDAAHPGHLYQAGPESPAATVPPGQAWCNHDDPATREETCSVCECGAVYLAGVWVGGPEYGGCARGSGEVYLVQRDNLDGLYLFEHEEDRDAYAALFPGCDTGTSYVINRHQAAIRIAEVCPGCTEAREDCDCPQPGDRVRMCDEDDGPAGIVALPTESEPADQHAPGAVFVSWPRGSAGGKPPPTSP